MTILLIEYNRLHKLVALKERQFIRAVLELSSVRRRRDALKKKLVKNLREQGATYDELCQTLHIGKATLVKQFGKGRLT